jgi:Uncharacterized protein conserved in bacteria
MRHILILTLIQLFLTGICYADEQAKVIQKKADLKQNFEEADVRLNDAYKKVMSLASETQRKSLRDTQRIWIKYRDAKCTDISDLSRAKDVSKDDILNECKIWESHKRSDELLCLSETLKLTPTHTDNKMMCAYQYPFIAKTDLDKWLPSWPKTNQIVKSNWKYYGEGEKGPWEGYVLEEKPLDYYRYNLVDYYPDLKFFGEINLDVKLIGKFGLYNVYDAMAGVIKLILIETRPQLYKPLYLLVGVCGTTLLPSQIETLNGRQVLITKSLSDRSTYTYEKSFMLNDKGVPTPVDK